MRKIKDEDMEQTLALLTLKVGVSKQRRLEEETNTNIKDV